MELPFIYSKQVTGKNFIGRKSDCNVVENLLANREHVCIYGAPKSGKKSLVQQCLYEMRISGHQFLTASVQLRDIRTTEAFLKRLVDSVMRAYATTPSEYRDLMNVYFKDTHFVFDRMRFSQADEIASLNWDVDDNDIRAAFAFPFLISKHRGERIIIHLEEFQNLDFLEDSYHVYKMMEESIEASRAELERPCCSYVITGSMVNAMKDIFLHRGVFRRQVEVYELPSLDEKDIIESVMRGMMQSGKVMERDLLFGVCKLFKNNIWYITHFVSICDHMSKGYIAETVLMEALNSIISIHEARFNAIMHDLTTYQVNMLKAIIDGHTKFSSADVIRQYGLNSSANVKRLKDALMKKEIITFDDKDDPVILDPLFEYWVTKEFFHNKVEL